MTGGPPAEPVRVGDRIHADVAIVGAGVAGLYAAVSLPAGLDVVMIDKALSTSAAGPGSGSSPWAQGGLAAAIGPDDTVSLHVADTIIAGDGLCDPLAVEVMAREAPRHVRTLEGLGAAFDRTEDASHALELAREGGQRVARSVKRADATGAELVAVLRAAAGPLVTRLVGIARSLAVGDDGGVTGLWVLDAAGRLVGVHARAVLIATGGCGALFAATTNPEGATGDGLALCAGAGAAVRDVELVQFHPTGLAVSGTWRLLLTEALRGAGATLHDRDGRRFLVGRHPDAELAPRHVVAKAILELPDGTAWLDATGLPPDVLEREFPTVLTGARRHGYDLATERVPVTPAAHYHMGGVRTDLWGRTSVPGLYAAGEAASTGVHGANRLAGNSLTESLVFAARAAETLARELTDGGGSLGAPPQLGRPHDPATLEQARARLRRRMLDAAGPTRDGAALETLAAELQELAAEIGSSPASHDAIELYHAVRTASLIVRGAILRTESRGGHWREDHPARDPRWDGVHLEQAGSREVVSG